MFSFHGIMMQSMQYNDGPLNLNMVVYVTVKNHKAFAKSSSINRIRQIKFKYHQLEENIPN